MIAGIGVDVVHVRRMSRWYKTPGLLERFFIYYSQIINVNIIIVNSLIGNINT